jgi:hypothetical protein
MTNPAHRDVLIRRIEQVGDIICDHEFELDFVDIGMIESTLLKTLGQIMSVKTMMIAAAQTRFLSDAEPKSSYRLPRRARSWKE